MVDLDLALNRVARWERQSGGGGGAAGRPSTLDCVLPFRSFLGRPRPLQGAGSDRLEVEVENEANRQVHRYSRFLLQWRRCPRSLYK